MISLRHFGVWITRAVLQLQLLAWIVATALVLLLGTPAPLKQALGKANIYDRVVDVALQQSTDNARTGDMPLDDQAIKDLIKVVFSEQQLRGYGENFLDGTYSWLEGKSREPSFRIDLTSARQSIASQVATRAAERLEGLPKCTKIPPGPIDPFKIDCLPPGVNIENEKQRITNEVLASKDFLPQTIITAEQLPKNAEGKTFAEANKNIPSLFQLLKKLPWILGATSVLTAAGLVALAENKRRGLKSVAKVALSSGGFVFGTTLLFGLLLPTISANLQAKFISGPAAPLLNDLLVTLVQETNRAFLISSGAVVAIGGGILLALKFIKPQPLEEDVKNPETLTLDKEPTKTPKAKP